MVDEEYVIDGTKLLAKDIANILNQYPMCDTVIKNNSLLVINHRGYVVKQINLDS